MNFKDIIPTAEGSQVTNLRQYLRSVINSCPERDLRQLNKLILEIQERRENRKYNKA